MCQNLHWGNGSFPSSVLKTNACDFIWKGGILKHFLREHMQGWYTEHRRGSGRWLVATSEPGEKQSTTLSLVCSPPLLPTFHPGTQINGRTSGSVLHLEEITQCLKHYPPVEITHDELVFAPSYLSSSPGHWLYHVLDRSIWKKVWSLLLCTGFFHETTPLVTCTHPGKYLSQPQTRRPQTAALA